jgi:hypothetical protein
MPSNLPVDAGRLWDDIVALAPKTDPEKPYTDWSFGALFKVAIVAGRAARSASASGCRADKPRTSAAVMCRAKSRNRGAPPDSLDVGLPSSESELMGLRETPPRPKNLA